MSKLSKRDMTMQEKEAYLFRVARRVLAWAKADYNEHELADLVMLELLGY
jgi:hypothetical protein